jgi:predicted ester cyclase
VDIFRLIGDKIAEQWVVMDVLGLMQQLGAVPIPA